MAKRRHCLVGFNDEGRPLFKAAGSKRVYVVCDTLEEGKALPPGYGLAHVEVEPDGRHAMIENIVAPPERDESDSAGPAQVATDAYRKGWERTFN